MNHRGKIITLEQARTRMAETLEREGSILSRVRKASPYVSVQVTGVEWHGWLFHIVRIDDTVREIVQEGRMRVPDSVSRRILGSGCALRYVSRQTARLLLEGWFSPEGIPELPECFRMVSLTADLDMTEVPSCERLSVKLAGPNGWYSVTFYLRNLDRTIFRCVLSRAARSNRPRDYRELYMAQRYKNRENQQNERIFSG